MLLPSLRLTQVPLSVGAMATYPWSDELARRFTLTTRFGDTYQLHRREGAYIQIPRAATPDSGEDRRSYGLPIDVKLLMGPKNEEQELVCGQINSLLVEGYSFIAVAPTGFGKTFCACSAIAAVKGKTLVVVPKEDLMSQWRDSFKKFLGLKDHEIGIIQADKVSVYGKKVVLGMIHSLALENRYDPELFKEFKMVVIDEVHRAAADILSNALCHLPARLRLGLSATPKRTDGKEQVLYAHIGPIMVEAKAMRLVPKVMSFRTGWKVPRVTRRDPSGQHKIVQMPHSPGKVMGILAYMAKSAERNATIGKLGFMAHSKGRNIVVFADTLDHIEAIVAAVRSAGVPHTDIARYIGGLSEAERERAKGKRFLVATWGMMSEGTDIPWLDTAILASPRSNITQAAGRILREHPDKKPPLILDLVDDDSRVFAGYYSNRRKWYSSIGAAVTEH